MKHLFCGGVHPAGRKELSSGRTPIPAPIPTHVIIPLSQHIGAPAQPLVKVGERVKLGQKIGDGSGLCVPVHASVSGKVIAVEPRRHTRGREVLSVVIENDYQDTADVTLKPHLSDDGLTDDEILYIIREAGIVGMGGATFPTDVKTQSSQGKIDTVIANACECEPYITADDTLLCTYPEQVIGGMKLLCRLLKPKRAVLAVEDNKEAAIATIRQMLRAEDAIELKILPTRYPQGAEKQLIRAVTGREVPPGGLPSAVNCAVFNASTFASVYKAVILGQPLTRRIVTVTGEGVCQPQNYIVRIGTPISELIRAAGGLTDDVWKVIAGGPMMGTAQKDLEAQYSSDAYIVKEVNEMISGMHNNIAVEEMIRDFGTRSGNPDIANFATVFETAYRTGGNIKEIIRRTTDIISEKIMIAEEIETKITSNKMQMRAMNVIPIFLVLMLRCSSSEFDAAFGSIIGVICMSIGVGFFLAAYKMGQKMMDIKG